MTLPTPRFYVDIINHNTGHFAVYDRYNHRPTQTNVFNGLINLDLDFKNEFDNHKDAQDLADKTNKAEQDFSPLLMMKT